MQKQTYLSGKTGNIDKNNIILIVVELRFYHKYKAYSSHSQWSQKGPRVFGSGF